MTHMDQRQMLKQCTWQHMHGCEKHGQHNPEERCHWHTFSSSSRLAGSHAAAALVAAWTLIPPRWLQLDLLLLLLIALQPLQCTST
jgi:hypothetical protein